MKKEPLKGVPLAFQTSHMTSQEEGADQEEPVRHSHSVTLRKAASHTAASAGDWYVYLSGLTEY